MASKIGTRVIIEEPILSYYSGAAMDCAGCDLNCDMGIRIYANDLRNAEVGRSWKLEDIDKCPNSTCRWLVSYTLIYKNEYGAAVLFRDENPQSKYIELLWVELSK